MKKLFRITPVNLLIWIAVVTLVLGTCTFSMVHNAYASDRIHYINLDTKDNSDHVVTRPEEWAFFKDIGNINVPWTFVDLQRDLLAFRQDVPYEGQIYPVCFIFVVEPDGVEKAKHIKDLPDLNITESSILPCGGIETWLHEEIK